MTFNAWSGFVGAAALALLVGLTAAPTDGLAKGAPKSSKNAPKGQKAAPKKKGGSPKGAKAPDVAVKSDVKRWILAHNPGLPGDFLTREPPGRVILLPDGRKTPIYKLKQFQDANFRLAFYVRKQQKGANIVPVMEERLKKLLCTPEFYEMVKAHKPRYKIAGRGRVSSQEAYNYIRHIHRRLSVTAGKQFRAPVGGGGGIAAPSWAVWKKMNIFWHEACHCIGIGHDSGGLSGPIAGKLERLNKQKAWNYKLIDLDSLRVAK